MEKAAFFAACERGKPPGVPGTANAAVYSGGSPKGQETGRTAEMALIRSLTFGLPGGLFGLRLERGDPRLQRFIFLARQPSHFLNCLEFLALNHIEVAK